MITRNVSRTAFQRFVGLPATPEPRDAQCWFRAATRVLIDLRRVPELRGPEGAVRLEGGRPPVRLLIFRGDDGLFHTICNKCGHRGRRLDPVHGGRVIQCCSLGRSTFDYRGRILTGPSCKALEVCPTRAAGSRVIVILGDPSNWTSLPKAEKYYRPRRNSSESRKAGLEGRTTGCWNCGTRQPGNHRFCSACGCGEPFRPGTV